jgi:acetylglutamate kinase
VSEILVVKLGGTTITDQQHVLEEVAAIARQRPVVLVHGGGRRITEWLDRLGVPSRFEGGLRVTDPAALEVAAAVLRGVVNSELVAGLRSLGVDAVGLSGVDGGLLIAERIPALGLVARVVGLRRDLLDAILQRQRGRRRRRHRRGDRRPPARPVDRRRRRPRRRRPKARHAHRR